MAVSFAGAAVPVKLPGNGHFSSIGAPFPASKCPLLPGETVAETVAVVLSIWPEVVLGCSLEVSPIRQVSLTETLDSLKAALADRYTLERELGRGGMAMVYLVHDLRHDRSVALKVLHPDLAATLGPERFQRTLRAVVEFVKPGPPRSTTKRRAKVTYITHTLTRTPRR